MSRAPGTGTIEPTVGGFRARLPGRGAKRLPGVFPTQESAGMVLDLALGKLAERPDQGRMSLATFGDLELQRREKSGMRSAAKARQRWNVHVAPMPLGKVALTSVAREDVLRFVDDLATRKQKSGQGHSEASRKARAVKPIAPGTAEAALVLVRVVLGVAHDRRLIPANPAAGVRLTRDVRKRPRTEEPSTFLTMEEQETIINDARIPLRERQAIAFAIGTGARQSEQWALRLADLDLRRKQVTLRHTKNGKPRVVKLFGWALAAVEDWLEQRAEEQRAVKVRMLQRDEVFTPSEWLWCSVRGHKRAGDHRDWQTWTETALPKAQRHDRRHIRWHDLRHTCGTSLVSGWWGRRWSKEETQQMLGHSSVMQVERYAVIADDVLANAADETSAAWDLLTNRSPEEGPEVTSKTLAPPARLERATFALGKRRKAMSSAGVVRVDGEALVTVRSRLVDALERVTNGAPLPVAFAAMKDAVRFIDAALAQPSLRLVVDSPPHPLPARSRG